MNGLNNILKDMIMLKKLILVCLGFFSLSIACAAGLGSPTYVQYSASTFEKRSALKSVIETANETKAQKIYIYYHDSKSQEMANKVSSKIQDKLPDGCSVVVLDQATGQPKYPSSITPEGITLFVQN